MMSAKKKKKVKALVLFSGGLDSILAAEVLKRQGIKVIGVAFKSYFFDSEQAEKSAEESGIDLKTMDFSKEHFKIVKEPKHGYGKNMNPCIDCHTLMLKKAKKMMKEENFDFVATGEVLGERPMSQNKGSLKLVEKESSLSGYLLRPLSAKLLEETIPEQKGWVDREELLDISGRSRKKQMKLAEEFGIEKYPTPAGGCLLTEPAFGKRLRELFKLKPEPKESDVNLLKYGRHFLEDGIKIIVGREEEENKKIERLKREDDVIIKMKNYPGPTTLIRSYNKDIPEEILKKAKELTKYYSTKSRNKDDVEFKIGK